MITHLELDILEYEVKWAMILNKVNGGDGIPAELFQILKDDAVKVLHKYISKFENSSAVTGLEKVSFHSNPEKGQWHNFPATIQLSSFHMLAGLGSKSFKLGFGSMWTESFQDVQTVFRKGSGTRDQIANIHWIIEKAKEFQKNIYFCFHCMNHNQLWKILKEMGVPDHLLVFWETCVQVKKQQLELDMEQLSDSKLGKEDDKAVYHHPAYLTYVM